MRGTAPPIAISLPRLHSSGIFQSVSRGFIAHSRYQYQSTRFASTRNGVFNVPVGGNGYISLRVTRPKPAKNSSGNVILHLPPGPLFQDTPTAGDNGSAQGEDGTKTIAKGRSPGEPISACALANSTSSTVVTINYRLGERPFDEAQLPLHARLKFQRGDAIPESLYYQYPTPVHDTLTGFDWVLQTLKPKRLGVVGTHIGGSLALMLALTEPRSVHAVAAFDPMCDWTSLDEYCTASSESAPRRKRAPRDLVPLLQARERFFANQARYFDFFASPILFLRSAGKETPKVFPKYLTGPEYPVPLLISDEPQESRELWDADLPERDDSEWEYYSLDPEGTYDSGYDSNGEKPPRRRKALSRWPPYGLDYGNAGPPERYSRQPIEKHEVTLPWVRIFSSRATHQDILKGESGATLSSDPEETSHEHEQTESEPERKPRRRRNHNSTVLSHQAEEMVDVMRRACFFGRERGFGEERVTLAEVGSESSLESALPSEETTTKVAEWLVESLESIEDEDVDVDANADPDGRM